MPVIDRVFHSQVYPLSNLASILSQSPVLNEIFLTFRAMVSGQSQIFGVVNHLLDQNLITEMALEDHPFFGQAGKY